jgi:hypothetical protein
MTLEENVILLRSIDNDSRHHFCDIKHEVRLSEKSASKLAARELPIYQGLYPPTCDVYPGRLPGIGCVHQDRFRFAIRSVLWKFRSDGYCPQEAKELLDSISPINSELKELDIQMNNTNSNEDEKRNRIKTRHREIVTQLLSVKDAVLRMADNYPYQTL